MEENQTSMPLNEVNGEIGENDVNMTESSPLSPENSLPERPSHSLARNRCGHRTTWSALTKLPPTPEETSRIIKAVTERRDQTSNNIAQPAAAAKGTGTKPKQPTKCKSSPDTKLDNTRSRRSTDKDGFTAPSRHLIALGTHYMPTPPDSERFNYYLFLLSH
ncbi:hypothetical protein CEXT_435171 [Caerostris extrusa]|uniref:Uncharacterized protein n=1 Tax=Caerostris extrusa TaxID=172846 RepID=A0AAV4SR40_CAEEX|nr:hypothetical protein CEXT_435171 [Caerostris extrusa]